MSISIRNVVKDALSVIDLPEFHQEDDEIVDTHNEEH